MLPCVRVDKVIVYCTRDLMIMSSIITHCTEMVCIWVLRGLSMGVHVCVCMGACEFN